MNPISSPKLPGVFQSFTQTFTRAFSATSVAAAKHSKRRLKHMMRNIPPYPYPIRNTFKQSWFGLYGGKHIQFGNNVPESHYKTRRKWLPNVRHRTVFSRALNQYFSIDITTSVLRSIDKAGGLDAYLTGRKPARIKSLGPTGWRLRCRVINSPRYQAQLAEERKALGLLPLASPQESMPGEEQVVSKSDAQEEMTEELVAAIEEPEAKVVNPQTAAQEMTEELVAAIEEPEVKAVNPQTVAKEKTKKLVAAVEEPEVKAMKPQTAAQALIEEIEREKGLGKDKGYKKQSRTARG